MERREVIDDGKVKDIEYKHCDGRVIMKAREERRRTKVGIKE